MFLYSTGQALPHRGGGDFKDDPHNKSPSPLAASGSEEPLARRGEGEGEGVTEG